MKRFGAAFALVAGSLSGGAVTGDVVPVSAPVAPQWYAALPPGADLGALRRRWSQLDDPLLARLIDAARAASPTIASADAQIAADNFELSVRATDARSRSGFGTPFELEDARRSALLAQNTLIDLRQERIAAWIALYRALGGGWSGLAEERTAATSPMPSTSP